MFDSDAHFDNLSLVNVSILQLIEILSKAPGYRILREIVEKIGAKKIGSGMFSIVYEYNGVCIKVSDCSGDFIKAERIMTDPRFKPVEEYIPQLYWVHPTGLCCICELVEIDDFTQEEEDLWPVWREAKEYICKKFSQCGIGLFDLHDENFVIDKKGRFKIVDYGCFF